jgi:hypothetical protein
VRKLRPNSAQVALSKYLDLLNQTAEKSQDAYDKLVIALSGGALGISMTLLKDFLGKGAFNRELVVLAWLAWTLSLAAALWSSFYSVAANRQMAKEVSEQNKIPSQKEANNAAGLLTQILNFVSGFFFVVGAFLIICFLAENIQRL